MTLSSAPPRSSSQARLSLAESVPDILRRLSTGDLSFKGRDTSHSGHNTHAYAAKFPPQLPRTFIENLTVPGEVVLDPMAGSGTAIIEAAVTGRLGYGVDFDPLASLITQAKVLPFASEEALSLIPAIEQDARSRLRETDDEGWEIYLDSRSAQTKEFIRYWFDAQTARELQSLATSIRRLGPPLLRPFLKTVFSSLIITKSGGVSLARDLAHSRPHKVSDKSYRDSLSLFTTKALKAVESLKAIRGATGEGRMLTGDARHLPVAGDSVHLIVTSPPYANAIDYVRAHKFSLVFLGWEIPQLGSYRQSYIGAERAPSHASTLHSTIAKACIDEIETLDKRRAQIIVRYFSEMTDAIGEMLRVLRPGRASVIVVGSSTVRGVRVRTGEALGEIAEAVGFKLVGIGERTIDRDKRLLPFSARSNGMGIEARMHTEEVVCLVKP